MHQKNKKFRDEQALTIFKHIERLLSLENIVFYIEPQYFFLVCNIVEEKLGAKKTQDFEKLKPLNGSYRERIIMQIVIRLKPDRSEKESCIKTAFHAHGVCQTSFNPQDKNSKLESFEDFNEVFTDWEEAVKNVLDINERKKLFFQTKT
jgi:hypothetical protein